MDNKMKRFPNENEQRDKEMLFRKALRMTVVFLLAAAAAFALVIALPQQVMAADVTYTSEETGYRAIVEDQADLLSDEQETKLLEKMKPLLAYGNMAFVTNETSNSNSQQFARSWFLDNFGETNGSVLMIDMYNRRIEIFSGADVFKQIGTARANEITDNIYTYASDGDYYTCADIAFDQMRTVLEGGAIVTPMRYATNALFAVGIVLLVNFIIIYTQRKKGKETLALRSANAPDKTYKNNGAVQNVTAVMTRRTSKRHVESSGGGGFSGGGGGGFGGGGGGGFSGGGGGHSF